MATILIVDDSITIQRMLSLVLQRMGHTTLIASDGGEALTCIATQWVDLVFVDMNMPGMGGISMVKHLRSEGVFAELPIVVLTSSSADVDREEALAAGATLYLNKPLGSFQLRGIVSQLISSESYPS